MAPHGYDFNKAAIYGIYYRRAYDMLAYENMGNTLQYGCTNMH